VQPVDPLNLWLSDPFAAELRDGRLYARGAQDNKGQLLYFIKALEAMCALGIDLPTVKILIEGEEESGSDALQAGLSGWGSALAADILIVCDASTVKMGVPTVTMGLRGIAHCEIRVHGPKADVHSGMFGGVIRNPIQALSSILASLHAADGSVAVAGFYEGVQEPSSDERAMLASADVDLGQMEDFLGVPLKGGESRFSPIERRGIRPTIEINGIGGGYQGPGSKTIIPSTAMAKLSMRLVCGQDPNRVLDAVIRHLHAVAPEGVTVEVVDQAAVGAALQVSSKSAVIETFKRAMSSEFDAPPAFVWEGGSLPIIPRVAQTAKAEPLLLGFGLDIDAIHSPNESFSLEQFEQGYRLVAAFLKAV
jgi:acetylornithine deacetylase/succinyl-diaminopimelate desuccinylase-like protein